MIIQCENCEKKFEVKDELIPSNGRLLQCSSCDHQWHFTPENKLELTQEVEVKVKQSKIRKKPEITNKEKDDLNHEIKKFDKKDKSIGIVSWLLVLILSIASFIVLVDTFQYQISLIFPDINNYMESLRELLTDIYLFVIDLIK
tara:strand:+ start:34 stop:465 length:432 start_codon:yes stop_codon:yes gene_type:complete